MLRMNTPASCACACMRTRSPSMAPPLNGLVGIDGDDADGAAGLAPPRDETVDERALSGARRAGDADEKCPPDRPNSSRTSAGPPSASFSTSEMPRAMARGSPDRIESARADNPRNLSRTCTCRTGLVQCRYHENATDPCSALALMMATPSIARADATRVSGPQVGRRRPIDHSRFCGRCQPARRRIRVRVRATPRKTTTEATPSLRTTSGNVFVQTFGLPGFQLYLTTGAGIYRERLGTDEETAVLLNNGGGIKINLAGPLRARVDYRVFISEGKSAAHHGAADLRGAQSGVLTEQRAERAEPEAVVPLLSALCSLLYRCVDVLTSSNRRQGRG